MSNGRTEDLRNTQNGRTEDADGKSWLRHREGTDAYIIDVMLKEGVNTMEDIALRVNKQRLDRSLSKAKERVKMHLEHLQNGHNYGQIPHGLTIQRRNGRLSLG